MNLRCVADWGDLGTVRSSAGQQSRSLYPRVILSIASYRYPVEAS